jgi:hypothetical protein
MFVTEILGYNKGVLDEIRPTSNSFPSILRRKDGNSRLFFGVPIKRNSMENWDFNSEFFWTKTGVTNLQYWEVEKVEGKWIGYHFMPKKIDTFHFSAEFPSSSVWACKKWKVFPKELPEKIVATLELIQKRIQLPKKLTIECSGEKIIDIHHHWNEVYSDLLIGQAFDIHVAWTFDSQQRNDEWFELELDPVVCLSVKPTMIKFEGIILPSE